MPNAKWGKEEKKGRKGSKKKKKKEVPRFSRMEGKVFIYIRLREWIWKEEGPLGGGFLGGKRYSRKEC